MRRYQCGAVLRSVQHASECNAAGVPLELRQVLLGHRNENITTHYSMPRIRALLEAAERVIEVKESSSVVRVVGGLVAAQGPPKVPQRKNEAA